MPETPEFGPGFQIEFTDDGSTTVRMERYDALYHSRHGALRESLHVFIEAGLAFYNKRNPGRQISILELGFGTGLNVILSFLFAKSHAISLIYTGLELYPLPHQIVDSLNYVELLQLSPDQAQIFTRMHEQQDFEIREPIHFQFQKWIGDQADYSPPGRYNLIYFDAFGPQTQPALWTKENLERYREWCRGGGVFVTYCSKGTVRRNLQALGFKVEKLPGPPGKREMIRAILEE